MKSFIRAFLINTAVVLFIGTATNFEGLAKATFNDKDIVVFNRINTGWLFVYFYVLLVGSRHSLEAVFLAFLLFYFVRTAIAVYFVDKKRIGISWIEIVLFFKPKIIDLFLYMIMWYTAGRMMQAFEGMKGFMFCLLQSLIHVSVVFFTNKKELLQFYLLTKNNS